MPALWYGRSVGDRWATAHRHRQHGRLVGIVDVLQGTFEQVDEGIGCVVRAELPIVDASSFTFALADVYNETVSRDALAAAGWVYEIEVDLS